MNNKDTTANHNGDSPQAGAPWLPIPSRAISVVEHPCIIKNLDKGIISLGGPVKLSKGLRSRLETTTNAEGDDEIKKLITVSLRPNDPFAKRLLSTPVRTNNLLLKVTVPKRTGRKRKRGTSGPFLTEDELATNSNRPPNDTPLGKHAYASASTIYASVRDNDSTYKVALAGVVDEAHRFRSMPDLQYAAVHNDTMVALRDHVVPKRYSQLKKYTLNTAAGADLTKSVGPSAEFLQMPIAFNYRFQQNTYVKYTEQGVVNLQKSIAYNAYTIIKPTDDHVPTGPKLSLPPEESLTPYLQTLIKHIKGELEKRPIITRHLLYNKLGWDKRTKLRQAAVYCGYFFESGPWREALVRWGVDPRKDSKYRRYQTVSFLSYLKVGTSKHHKGFDQHVMKLSQMTPGELKTQHTFDGVNVSQTGNLFQFCDITDPLIAKILATDDIRTTCAPTFQGWYHAGTWAKATVILKDKMNTIIGKERPDDTIYQRIIEWPEQWDDQTIAATYKEEVNDRQVHDEKKREHDVMHHVRWAARNPRYAFETMETPSEPVREAEAEETSTGDIDIPEDMTENPVTVEEFLDESEMEENGDESNEDEDDEDENENVNDEGDDQDEDVDGVWEADDDGDSPAMSARAASEGPAPFGGLYRV
ncbi:transcription factor tfiiic complex a box associated subunit sfc1 [Cucurbitaria berberidis CBS 394.84]|uniref:Transcription factor tfiiic complex a box associated subunit sfc1 n=1 Tax=Cucurbitaria berberidis CBS 394.84 TaxID=1168544 RepID=A0A9P4GLR1_9PLEO|nr:transcription factor tfiiic complex a box associated subunit sfc1 [Cucurbitaria berberidis CBS 394.84]KAF1847982.1 transcription factor tfiiic complex a box associated subunit sfc1 [Cucurbitaria berberidis CBS 394.84]